MRSNSSRDIKSLPASTSEVAWSTRWMASSTVYWHGGGVVLWASIWSSNSSNSSVWLFKSSIMKHWFSDPLSWSFFAKVVKFSIQFHLMAALSSLQIRNKQPQRLTISNYSTFRFHHKWGQSWKISLHTFAYLKKYVWRNRHYFYYHSYYYL